MWVVLSCGVGTAVGWSGENMLDEGLDIPVMMKDNKGIKGKE